MYNIIMKKNKLIRFTLLSILLMTSCFSGSGCIFGHVYSSNFYKDEEGHALICDVCGEKEKLQEHNYSSPTINGLTGETYVDCYECGYRKIEVNQQCNHNYIEVKEKDATCLEFGNKLYYKCDMCEEVFDHNKVKTELSKVLLPKKPHVYKNVKHDIVLPTWEQEGTFNLICDTCDSYLSYLGEKVTFTLPKLKEMENYEVLKEEGANIICKLKEEAIRSQVGKYVSTTYSDLVTDTIVNSRYSYSSCSIKHSFTPNGFVNENNKLFYVCKNDSSHKLEVKLPPITSSEYYKSWVGATCISNSGYNYSLNQTSWKNILNEYKDSLVMNEEFSLIDYANVLVENFNIFKEEIGTKDESKHPQDSISVNAFTEPTYNLQTNTKTNGKIVGLCTLCKKELIEEVDYSSCYYVYNDNAFNKKYYRNYNCFKQTFKVDTCSSFSYYINTNGGKIREQTPVETYKTPISGSLTSGSIFISKYQFEKEGYDLIGIKICVDGDELIVNSGDYLSRVKNGTLTSPGLGTYTYWEIGMDIDNYQGDVYISLNWQLK